MTQPTTPVLASALPPRPDPASAPAKKAGPATPRAALESLNWLRGYLSGISTRPGMRDPAEAASHLETVERALRNADTHLGVESTLGAVLTKVDWAVLDQQAIAGVKKAGATVEPVPGAAAVRIKPNEEAAQTYTGHGASSTTAPSTPPPVPPPTPPSYVPALIPVEYLQVKVAAAFQPKPPGPDGFTEIAWPSYKDPRANSFLHFLSSHRDALMDLIACVARTAAEYQRDWTAEELARHRAGKAQGSLDITRQAQASQQVLAPPAAPAASLPYAELGVASALRPDLIRWLTSCLERDFRANRTLGDQFQVHYWEPETSRTVTLNLPSDPGAGGVFHGMLRAMAREFPAYYRAWLVKQPKSPTPSPDEKEEPALGVAAAGNAAQAMTLAADLVTSRALMHEMKEAVTKLNTLLEADPDDDDEGEEPVEEDGSSTPNAEDLATKKLGTEGPLDFHTFYYYDRSPKVEKPALTSLSLKEVEGLVSGYFDKCLPTVAPYEVVNCQIPGNRGNRTLHVRGEALLLAETMKHLLDAGLAMQLDHSRAEVDAAFATSLRPLSHVKHQPGTPITVSNESAPAQPNAPGASATTPPPQG